MALPIIGVAARAVVGRSFAQAGRRAALTSLATGGKKDVASMGKNPIAFNVTSDAHKVSRYLNALQMKQMPFAITMALNDTAFDARREVIRQMDRKLKNPTPWTKKGIMVAKAKKTKLRSIVYVSGTPGLPGENLDRAEYLRWVVYGGTRQGNNGKKIPVPTRNKKLNQYGNIAGKRSGLVKGKKQFIATINGIAGVWQKDKKTGLQLMIQFHDQAQYRPQFAFHKIVMGVASSKYSRNFSRRLDHALATAR